jgi:hypothetical protein
VLPEFQRDPFTLLRTMAADFGDVFWVPLPMIDTVCVQHIMATPVAVTAWSDRSRPLSHTGCSPPCVSGAGFDDLPQH